RPLLRLRNPITQPSRGGPLPRAHWFGTARSLCRSCRSLLTSALADRLTARRHRRARGSGRGGLLLLAGLALTARGALGLHPRRRSEEHTSELQSRENLVCRLLLEKKNCNVVIL